MGKIAEREKIEDIRKEIEKEEQLSRAAVKAKAEETEKAKDEAARVQEEACDMRAKIAMDCKKDEKNKKCEEKCGVKCAIDKEKAEVKQKLTKEGKESNTMKDEEEERKKKEMVDVK